MTCYEQNYMKSPSVYVVFISFWVFA